jgi:sterol desaturase/sphingolipid hydroxylase (fatty acid hydroxylase superfamily)
MKAFLRVATFPILVVGPVAAAWAMLRAGISPFVVIVVISPAAAAIVIGLERVIPFRPEWNHSHGDFRTDCTHLVLSAWAVESVPAVAHGTLVVGAAKLAGLVGRTPWPIEWSIWTQLVLALVVSEFFHYAVHRALHSFAPLWRLHAVHHSSQRLYWLNATRVHPFEGLIHIATGATALVLLGVPTGVLTLHAVFLGVARLFQHANLDVRLGPLNSIFSATEVHRFHHSTDRADTDANYGTALLVWDWIFGTRRAVPNASAPATVGGPRLPSGWLGQVLWSFKRQRRASERASTPTRA